MTTTRTCGGCFGSGADSLGDICVLCSGNGYLAAEPSLHDALENLRAAETTAAPIVDLQSTTPAPGRMTNQTWRILEEQRLSAEETILECEAEIARWTAKLDDAMRAKVMAEAGQKAKHGRAGLEALRNNGADNDKA